MVQNGLSKKWCSESQPCILEETFTVNLPDVLYCGIYVVTFTNTQGNMSILYVYADIPVDASSYNRRNLKFNLFRGNKL